MIHGKPVTEEQIQKEIETQKEIKEFIKSLNNPAMIMVSENPNGDGDHITSMILAGLNALSNNN